MITVIIIMSRLLALDSMMILFAMCWDLAVGLRKAKQRGEARTSYGVARTATKLLTYFGAFGVGSCIDVLLHVGKLWELCGIEVLHSVPVVATIIAIFLCVIELMSIFESADSKTKKRLAKATNAAVHIANKEEFVELLARAIAAARENTKEQ